MRRLRRGTRDYIVPCKSFEDVDSAPLDRQRYSCQPDRKGVETNALARGTECLESDRAEKDRCRTRTQRLNPHNSQCETQGTRAGSTSGVHFLIQGLEVVAIMACLIYPGAAFSVTSVSQTLSVIAYRCSSTRRIRYPRRVS